MRNGRTTGLPIQAVRADTETGHGRCPGVCVDDELCEWLYGPGRRVGRVAPPAPPQVAAVGR